jgi:hypothetical protein
MSYSNYSTYLKYKNCCRPIGDTGPPGPVGPTGPAATIDIPGNKGEILYFSVTDNLVSTDNVFIQEGNVTINNNLVVTGTTDLNNTLDVSGSTTIQNGILKVLNPNDKKSSQFQTSQGTIFIGASDNTRFGDVSYNLIFSTGTSNRNGLAIGTLSNTEPLIFGVDNTEVIRITDNGEQRVGIKTSNPSATLEVSGNVIFNGNLSMSDQFINDVSGIYFSDGTYIGHGASFDITTSERLDISAAGNILFNNQQLFVNSTNGFVGIGTSNPGNRLDINGGTIIRGRLNMLDNVTGNLYTPLYNQSGFTIIRSAPSTNTINLRSSDLTKLFATFNLDNTEIISSNISLKGNVIFNGNLSMSDQFINDVSGIYFSDGTYISHGSSFDITTSQTLDISAAGGIHLNTDVTINSNITINSNLTANTINTQRLLFPGGNYIDYEDGVGELYVNGNTTLAHRVQLLSTLDVSGATTIRSTLDISGNLSMNKNSIKDVDTIYFSKNTYITSNNVDDKLRLYGNSIFMEASVNGNFVFTGNSTNVDLNFLTLSPSGYTINYNHIDDKIKFNTNDFVIDKGNNYIGIQTDTPSATLEVNGNAIISGNLSMSNQFINDVSGIYFTQGNLLFSDFSSVNQNVQLPSSQGQPISLERKTLFNDENFNINTGGIPIDISFVVPNFNQLGLTISGSGNTIISPSLDISGQYVEIYANFLVNSTNSNSKTISLDISGVSSGSSFNETIDVRSISKLGSYYITFGPHIFTPEQWAGTSDFVITANTSDTFDINKYKLMFKSYFM